MKKANAKAMPAEEAVGDHTTHVSTPYKVIWEAYGKSHFHPVILNSEDGQVWQANQAMHAFIPCWNEADAKRIRSALQHPTIPALLKQLNGNGKCNWAQPGKIKQILDLGKPACDQPQLPLLQ